MKILRFPLFAFIVVLTAVMSMNFTPAEGTEKSSAPAIPPAGAAEAPTPTPPTPAVVAGDVTRLRLGVIPGAMQFDKKILTVKTGAKVMLLFENLKDPMQHNFLLLKPGKLPEVGALADKMMAVDPAAALKNNYFPVSPEIVLHGGKLVGLGQNDLLQFTAPAQPGDYPYCCTFPSHWRLMNGILKVEP